MTPPTRRRVGVASAVAALALAGTPLALAPTSALAAPPTEPDVLELSGDLAEQDLAWGSCDFSAYADDVVAQLESVDGLACATVTVPRDWHDPDDGHTLTVEVSRTATSTGNADRQGIAFVNPGGPGGEGLVWGPAMAMQSPTLAEAYDFVGLDPRGVGQSTPLECDVEVDPAFTADEQTQALVEGCLANPLTPYITTEQTVYDLDFVRALLGEPKASVVGYSYGTWLGAWYGSTFPSRTHRLLLDSSTDLSRTSLQKTWDLQPHSRDRQFEQALMPYIARNPDVFYMGDDPQAIRQAWERAGGTRDYLGQLLTSSLIIPAMYDTSQYVMAGMTVRIYAYFEFVAGQSDEDALQVVVDQLLAEPALTESNREFVRAAHARAQTQLAQDAGAQTLGTQTIDGAFEAIRCQDGAWSSSQGYWNSWLDRLDAKAPFIAPFMSTPACAWWPAQTSMPKLPATLTPATLVVQSELDAATAYEGAAKAVQNRANTSMISVDDEGSHGVYPYLTSCVDDQVEAFMLHGTKPGTAVCEAKPLPLETQTFATGAELGGNGKLKVKTVPQEVREANAFVRSLLSELASTP